MSEDWTQNSLCPKCGGHELYYDDKAVVTSESVLETHHAAP